MEVSDKDVAHFWGNNNIGLICDGIVVVDFDTGLEERGSGIGSTVESSKRSR